MICPRDFHHNDSVSATPPSHFHQIWDLYTTVPVVLGVIMFPLLNFKSATFFTKFNSLGWALQKRIFLCIKIFLLFALGTFSVMYLILFVSVKGFFWGVNIPDWSMEWRAKPTFFVLSGMLSMSFFIHNIIISIMKNNRHQECNVIIFFAKKKIGALFFFNFRVVI